jgi:hypothetical protein
VARCQTDTDSGAKGGKLKWQGLSVFDKIKRGLGVTPKKKSVGTKSQGSVGAGSNVVSEHDVEVTGDACPPARLERGRHT